MGTSRHTIRLAGAADLADICRMVNHWIATSHVNFRTEPQEVGEWLSLWEAGHERYPWLVAVETDPPSTDVPAAGEAAERVVAACYAVPWSPRGAYGWTAESVIYLRPEARGTGLGRRLYDLLLTMLEAQGFRAVHAGVAQPNPGSDALHRGAGFEPVGVFTGAGFKNGEWRDVAYWRRTLGPGTSEPPGELRPVAKVAADLGVPGPPTPPGRG
ncbi:GNAT family N-acetyltransferase [Streptomyces sp. ST2-7A]|uniref:GNAT family N-acetyltransferase n=1 Tax=Streptomyces sp. ST2-7A TaxID=2907214 RepID=UPI001F42A154|nr:GNAT family N-acetyltransferase [Streptomyces sp. ST2-7A]MCE7082431.1 N-acetyltransferase family protein [Streptomyces sp. ST2-7A]